MKIGQVSADSEDSLKVRCIDGKVISSPSLIWLTPQLVESFFRQSKGFVDDARVAKKLMILNSCLDCGLDERGVIHKV